MTFLEIKDIKDMELIRQLPLAVVLKIEGRKMYYKINDEDSFYDGLYAGGGPFEFPPIDTVEKLCRRYGIEISESEFEESGIVPAESWQSGDGLNSWETYRTKFKK